MAIKMIALFLFGMLHAELSTADSHEAMKIGKAMSKFMPAVRIPRPVSQGIAAIPQSDPSMQPAILKTLVDIETRSHQMQAEYQHLRARLQKMPQANDQASFGSAASLGWLAGFIASVGLAASVGVAAVRKYSGHGKQGSEPTSGSQISPVPQRVGLIVASAAATPPVAVAADDAAATPGRLRRCLQRVAKAVMKIVASVMIYMRPAHAMSTGATTTTQATQAFQPIIPGFGIAFSAFIMYWGYKSAQNDDKEEVKRIKKETERLNDAKLEFTEMDGKVFADDDLAASLRKRLEGLASDGDTGDPNTDDPLPA